MIQHMFPAWDLYYTDPAQHLIITAGYDIDDLDDVFIFPASVAGFLVLWAKTSRAKS